MKFPDNRILFTVNEVSKTCGISRATLLRMEESGFLTPYRTDPDSGYRYYDTDNITQIGQYQLLMDLGLSRKEASDLYYRRPNMKELLKNQREKINRLQRLLNELEVRYERTEDVAFSFVNLPETTCICEPFQAASFEEAETLAYSLAQNVIKEGVKVNITEPLFMLRPTDPQEKPQICFPVIPSDMADPRLRTFPACYAYSAIAHGDYSVVYPFIEKFRAQFSANDLRAAGPGRLIVLVAPYAGEHIAPEDYCYEIVVPIEK